MTQFFNLNCALTQLANWLFDKGHRKFMGGKLGDVCLSNWEKKPCIVTPRPWFTVEAPGHRGYADF